MLIPSLNELICFICSCRENDGVDLLEKGKYATGIFFLDKKTAPHAEKRFEELAVEHGLKVLHWRTVPSDSSCLGEVAISTEPFCRQVFVFSNEELDEKEFEKRVSLNLFLMINDLKFLISIFTSQLAVHFKKILNSYSSRRRFKILYLFIEHNYGSL